MAWRAGWRGEARGVTRASNAKVRTLDITLRAAGVGGGELG